MKRCKYPLHLLHQSVKNLYTLNVCQMYNYLIISLLRFLARRLLIINYELRIKFYQKNNTIMIQVTNLSKVFRTEEIETTALNNVSFTINKGE